MRQLILVHCHPPYCALVHFSVLPLCHYISSSPPPLATSLLSPSFTLSTPPHKPFSPSPMPLVLPDSAPANTTPITALCCLHHTSNCAPFCPYPACLAQILVHPVICFLAPLSPITTQKFDTNNFFFSLSCI